jgi:excinuclease ABC subunit A
MMKKLLSAVLALVLTVSFGVTAFAAEVGEGEHSTSVFANYDPDVITVDLEWGSMQFEYFDGLEGSYGESWVPVEETNRIFVKNACPNTAIAVSYTFELVENAEELGVQGVYYDWHYEKTFSSKFACPDHGVSIEELEPRMFSFNAPFGACPVCNGIGYTQKLNPDKIIRYDLSIPDGALSTVFGSMEFSGFYRQQVNALAEDHGVDINKPLIDLPETFVKELLYGTGERNLVYYYTSANTGSKTLMNRPFEGVINNIERRYRETTSDYFKNKMDEYMSIDLCPSCQGKRLKPEVLAVTVGGINIADFSEMSIKEALDFVEGLELTEKEQKIAHQVLKEIKARLKFLIDVGLDYLT